jgi:hypothetical protein
MMVVSVAEEDSMLGVDGTVVDNVVVAELVEDCW